MPGPLVGCICVSSSILSALCNMLLRQYLLALLDSGGAAASAYVGGGIGNDLGLLV